MTFQGEFQVAQSMPIEPCTGLYENSLGVVSQDTTQLAGKLQTRGFQRVKLQKIHSFSVPNTYMYVPNAISYSACSFNDQEIENSAFPIVNTG